MNTSGEAAEVLIRIYLEGAEVGLRLTGCAAKNIAAALIALNKEQKFSTGKTKLSKMIRSGKDLKIFSIRQSDLRKFTQESKTYGVLFCALMSKKEKDSNGLIDIMVRAEDASKVNRIIEKFNLSTPDITTIKREVEKDISKLNSIDVETKSKETKILDDIKNKPLNKEKGEHSNPELAQTEKNPLSEHTLKGKENLEVGTKLERTSVREKIKKIKDDMKKSNLGKSEIKKTEKRRETKHEQPKRKKKYKEKQR